MTAHILRQGVGLLTRGTPITSVPTTPGSIWEDHSQQADGPLDPTLWLGITNNGAGSSSGYVGGKTVDVTGPVGGYTAYNRRRANHVPQTDMELAFIITVDPNKREQYPMFGLQCDTAWHIVEQPQNGYEFIMDTFANNITIRKSVAGTASPVSGTDAAGGTTSTPAFLWLGGATYLGRIQRQGTALRVKVWLAGSGSAEPINWTWTGVDSSITAAGYFAFALTGGTAAQSTSITTDDLILYKLDTPPPPVVLPPTDPGTGLVYNGPKLTLADVGLTGGSLGSPEADQHITANSMYNGHHYTGATYVEAGAAGSLFNNCLFDGYLEVRAQVTFTWCRLNGQWLIRETSSSLTRCGLLHPATDGLDFFRVNDPLPYMDLLLRECVLQQDGSDYPVTAHGDTFQAVGYNNILAVGCVFDMLITPQYGAGGIPTVGAGRTSAFNTQPAINTTVEAGPCRTFDCWVRGGSFNVYAKTYDPAIAASTIIHTRMRMSADDFRSYAYRALPQFPGATFVDPRDWFENSLVGV